MGRRRPYVCNLPCAHTGCKTRSYHEADTLKDANRLSARRDWLCDEHRGLDHRLLPERMTTVARVTNTRSRNYPDLPHLYWDGSNGILHGPGFEARSKDWPEGTVIEVTARVILPGEETNSDPKDGGTER